MKRKASVSVLFHHRWTVPILAELHRRQGERFAYLAHRFGVSRETLSQTLSYMIDNGWVRRNPGYGHPLRPEYILTVRGEKLGPVCAQLEQALESKGFLGVGLRKWSMPLIHALSKQTTGSRFSELLGLIGGATPRALSDCLKSLEEAGLIVREVTDDFPPSTRYKPTRTAGRYRSQLNVIVQALG